MKNQSLILGSEIYQNLKRESDFANEPHVVAYGEVDAGRYIELYNKV